jgi:catechol 2,3-dioxygenase-like lactoylglutathione lyase family enzyme
MKFGHTEIFVKDPMKSKYFYIDVLGFELVEVQADKFVWLKSGDALVLLRPSGGNSSRAADYGSADTGFVIYTDNLQESAQKMKSSGLVFKGTDGSDKCLTFTDPDGNWFQLVDPKDH